MMLKPDTGENDDLRSGAFKDFNFFYAVRPIEGKLNNIGHFFLH